MHIYIVTFFSVLILSSTTLYSYLSLIHLAQIPVTCFYSKRHLSPLVGALVYESGLLLDFYNKPSLTNTKPTTKTELLLYYLFRKDKDHFAPTVARNNPATYLTTQDTAQLLSCLEQNNFDTYAPELYKKLAAQAQATYPADYNKASFRKHFNHIISYIQESQKECLAGLYHLFTPHAILAAFFYCKATELQQVKEYARELALNWDTTTNENSNSNSLCGVQDREKSYSNYYMSALELIAHRTYLTALPPCVPQGYYGYQQSKAVPDCFETVIREFCNVLLYNSAQHTFDITYLSSNCCYTSEFEHYYTYVQPSAFHVKTQSAGQKWLDYVSGKNTIEYVSGNYEMRPTIANFIAILNYFFGLTTTNLEELCIHLSTDTKKITCVETQQQVYGNYKGLHQTSANVLEFFIQEPSQKYSFSISLIPFEHIWHAWIHIPQRADHTIYKKLDASFLGTLKSFEATIEYQAIHKLIS